jgi:alpha-ketoglutarate-dependent taurine dioxygenase
LNEETAVGTPARKPARRVVLSSATRVAVEEIRGGETTIKVVLPLVPALDLASWIQHHQERIAEWLARCGGVLWRGFDLDLDTAFQPCAAALIGTFQPYHEGATPRTRLSHGIYTSTEFPSDQVIAQHNELSYTTHWPQRISFACREPALSGGETPLTDVRRVLANLAPALVARFVELGWMLVRNYGNGLGPSWQKAFNATSLAEVQEYCAKADIELEIFDAQRIRTRQRRPAIRQHPLTGEAVWFNHVAFWHPGSLELSVRAGLLAQFRAAELPYYTCWGDGTVIDDAVIAQINRAYERATLTTPWQRNDVLLLDNMLIAHGRRPFTGPRSVIVAMG